MKKLLPLLLVLLLTVLAACNNDDNNEDEDTSTNETTNEEQASEEENDSTEETRSITINDATGEKTIEGTPERIVVLEWTYAEDLLALDVQPVGVADMEGYESWVNVDIPFDDSVEDVGTRQEPNLEAISRLDPDLIIGVDYRHEAILSDLENVADTVLFSPYGEEAAQDQFKDMVDSFNMIGEIVDKEDQAEEVLDHMNQVFDEQSDRIADAEIENNAYVLTQAFTSQNTPTLRLFTDNSIAATVMNNLGLENAYESEQLEAYGYSSTTVETLQNFQDAHFFYIVQDDDNIFDDQLAGNPVWENLEFVQEERTHKLAGNTWTFGGPISAEVLAKQITDAMLNE
ncbi:ABC transporter substrate-binding protein [Aquibacillus sediminis]|uniref:ABC transporter substrate-binding protein n=1 Tax=Aquibacillus sediminis TaxID=2574734 RepID=UPI001108FAC9|nr:iron-siderophore ABC transporter substrate-binding protein [Aquibacillus sediminis]